MYIEKINCLATEIEEINKRENIIDIQVDEVLETEILQYKEEIDTLRELLKTKKQLLKNYKKL